MIKKISLKTAGSTCILISILTIIFHLLVIFKIMPFTWINGGMSETFEIALKTSFIGIVILLLWIPIYVVAGGWISLKKFKWLLTTLLWVIFVFSSVSIVLQFLGTPFEKMCTSFLSIINAIMTFRLAIEKR